MSPRPKPEHQPSAIDWRTWQQVVSLKNMDINVKTMIDANKLAASKLLSKEQSKRLSITLLDAGSSNAGSSFRYHLIDSLNSTPSFRIFLIGREYTEENIAWIASYNSSGALIDHMQVYYDNAEGNLSKETSVKSNRISVKTQTEYEESEIKSQDYYFNSQGKIMKVSKKAG